MTLFDTAVAAAGPAGAGLRLATTVETVRAGGAPRIAASLAYARYPGDGAQAYTPVRIPEHLRLRLEDVDAGLIESALLRFTARLRSGQHLLPLAGGPPLRVLIAPGTVVRGALDAGPAEAGDGAVVVRALDLDLTPAATLENVLEALVEVQHLFADRRLAALLGGATLGGLLDRARAGLGGGGFGARALEPLQVRLARVSARPRRRRGGWELELAFTGHVQVGARFAVPFREVVLPAAVLPVLHATLARLASRTPLASGELRADHAAPRAALAAARAMIESVAGDLHLVLDPPALAVASHQLDRTRFEVTARLPRRAALDATFQLDVHGERAELALPAVTLGFAGHPEATLQAEARATVHLDLESPDRGAADRVAAEVEVALTPGAVLPQLEVTVAGSHPLAAGGAAARVLLTDLKLAGTAILRVGDGAFDLEPQGDGLELACDLELPDQPLIQRARSSVAGAARGELSATVAAAPGGWDVHLEGSARLTPRFEAQVAPVPELNIEDHCVRGQLEATVAVDARATLGRPGADSREVTVSPTGAAEVTVARFVAELDHRRLELPAGTTLTGAWREGTISAASAGDFAIDVGWDLHGRPFLLHGADRSVSLLAPALRQGELTMHVSPGGRFSFSGEREGLYGVRYFNALLDPAKEAAHAFQLLESDDALTHVVAALEVFNPELAELVATARRFALRLRDHLKAEEITRPADAIPRPRLARILSLAIAGSGELEERLVPLLKDVTEGRGLDLDAAKSLLREHLGGRRLDYEVDGVLRWLDLVTGPSEPFPRATAPAPLELPLPKDPRYAADLAGLPSAAELYRAIDARDVAPALLERLTELAPYLTIAQIDYVLAGAEGHWPGEALKRLRHVREAKRRVARIEEGYGGLAFAAQSATIAGFLGEAVGPLPSDGPLGPGAWPPPLALGPRDLAMLLLAGLAEGHQGLQTQINNRMILDLCRAHPGELLREVLVEAGQQVPRVLVGVLFAFLHQDQDELQEPIDLPALLEEKLGVKVPRQADFMAGGRRVRDSYYEALAQLADEVFAQAGGYLARRAHLREVEHPVPRAPRAVDHAAVLAREAQAAIKAADQLGRRLQHDRRPGPAHRAARAAYKESFAACAALLAELPTGFQLPWFKRFWARNEEALKVRSVVRNVQDDIDDVRRWLTITSGAPLPAAEQALLETVVRTLYFFPADQRALLRDPLVRLLITPEAGHYDFTIVGAMGVVTDGAAGRELEDAYRRLEAQRGVRIIRAHTGLFRSLEYNAAAIIRAAQGATTPWGYIGYSQGCPNGLLAESFLYCGTPAQRRLADRLVCRNLLFSAVNGSVHGTSGSLKFMRAMIEGERFLKHYQASYSRELVQLGLRLVRALMDSAPFVNTLGGAHSLSLERARALHRDRQCRPDIPTSSTRGVITFDRIPEALEYLYCVHERLLPGALCDSQVPAEEALGHATRVRNDWTVALERCDMGSLVQSTHHWSPLTAEIEFLTTPRDRERAVYQGPKDRHVFPWLEVNARFGRIRRFRPRRT